MKRIVAAVLPCLWLGAYASPPPAPEPDARLSVRSGVPQELLQRGHQVYLMQCGRCHDHVLPDDVTRADWHVVLPGMAWNAGLTPADEQAVMAYIMATTTP
jgi:hypothetical protein